MSFWKWSQTAASNSSADGSINWAEGQAPSSVNDSARAMMAAAAKYRDDIAGAIATGGTSTAYTVTSYQVFDTLAHLANQMIAFTPHTTNGATVTLNVDGLGAKPLRPAPSVELQTGALVQGTPYIATYNNSDAVFYLHGAANYNSYSTPLAGAMVYFGSSAPNSAFAFPYGQAISRTTYATLFAVTSTTFGTGDGSTTFNLPDLRGRVIAGLDNMGGSTANRLLAAGFASTTLGGAAGAPQVTLTTPNLPAYTPSGTVSTSGTGQIQTGGFSAGSIQYLTKVNGGTSDGWTLTSTFTGTAQGGTSTAFNTIPPMMVANYIMRII